MRPAALDICPGSGTPDDMTDDAATMAADNRLQAMEPNPEGLEIAAAGLERCLGAPSATSQWRIPVLEALARTQTALEGHLRDPGKGAAVADSVVREAPRLARQARRLTDEHVGLLESHRAATALAQDDTTSPDDVRDSAAELAALMHRHVHHAHDLIHDAFESDLGDGD